MLIVRVELHSANTGLVTEIGRMEIANDKRGSKYRDSYNVSILRGQNAAELDKCKPERMGFVTNWPRDRPVWVLVSTAIHACGFLARWAREPVA
jgi:hypothetical protein